MESFSPPATASAIVMISFRLLSPSVENDGFCRVVDHGIEVVDIGNRTIDVEAMPSHQEADLGRKSTTLLIFSMSASLADGVLRYTIDDVR